MAPPLARLRIWSSLDRAARPARSAIESPSRRCRRPRRTGSGGSSSAGSAGRLAAPLSRLAVADLEVGHDVGSEVRQTFLLAHDAVIPNTHIACTNNNMGVADTYSKTHVNKSANMLISNTEVAKKIRVQEHIME